MNHPLLPRPRAALQAAALVMIAALTACGASKQPAAGDAAATDRGAASAAAAAALARAQRPVAKACDMVTEAEMSGILGVAVSAKDLTHSSGQSDCQWAAPSGFPAVELKVDWGDGEVAMRASGFMNRKEPGIVSPYDGIGDQAIAVGPALMIKTGDDLVQLIFTGVEGAPAKAKKIFDTAKARM
jgi:hypothetical protein